MRGVESGAVMFHVKHRGGLSEERLNAGFGEA